MKYSMAMDKIATSLKKTKHCNSMQCYVIQGWIQDFQREGDNDGMRERVGKVLPHITW